MTDRLVLVTGASGYIASRLIPQLVGGGVRVRVLAREPRRLEGRKWAPDVELAAGDTLNPATLPEALKGVHTAYYLIHNMLSGKGYIAREREGARSFAGQAEAAGVRHIIYLGGLADEGGQMAPHLRSRIETGEVLRQGGVPVTEFRAGAIIGAGSISFEMIRYIMEQFPLLPGPRWLRNRTQPIAIANILAYLTAALDQPGGGIHEIGGPQVMTYAEAMQRYARLRGLRRVMMKVPGMPLGLMAWCVDRLTPVPFPIAVALVEGLRADSVVRNDSARTHFPAVQLIPYEQALAEALALRHPDQVERVWDTRQEALQLKHEGFFIEHQRRELQAAAERVFSALERPADYITESIVPGQRLVLHAERQGSGHHWLEWTVEPAGRGSALTLTSFFAARGFAGHLHWSVTASLRRRRFAQWFAVTERRASSFQPAAE
jgi:uncharacterized protein YbjT (DUF2867 family)